MRAAQEVEAGQARPRSLLARARPLMLARLAAAALSFAIPLALARAFPQAEYGTYKLLVIVAQTLYYVLPFGVAQSLYYFLPRVHNRRAWLAQTLGYLLLAGAAGGLALYFGRHLLGRALNNEGVASYAVELALYTMGLVGSMPLEVSQTARGMTRRAAWTYLVSDGLKAAVMTLPAVLGFGLEGVMAGMAAFGLVRLAATWIVLLRSEPGPVWDFSGLREQLRYALPFGAAMAVAVPQQYFHQFVVSSHLDAATFALYAVGVFQVPIIDLVYTPTSEVLMVRIAELEREGQPEAAAAAFREAVGHLAQLFVPLSVFLVAAAPEFIGALFTSRYLGSVPVFRVVSLSVVLACAPLDGVLRARDQTGHILKSYLAKAAVNVPLVLLGVAHFGMMGGVLAYVASELVGKAMLASRVPQALGVGARELVPVADLARAVAASLLALGGVYAARVAFGPGANPWVAVFSEAAGFGLGYLSGLLATGARLPFGAAPVAQPVRLR